ncbi:MAG: phenylalanine--tRNA ligase subunit beta, partial [bacterium]
MKISYNWLKDYLDLSVDPHHLADRLSLIGLEVEEVIERKFDFPQVVVGQILGVDPHPNADKLSLCRVTTGDEELSIICGATNVASGQVVAVAKIGATLPQGLKIHKTKIRNVESEGMICSQAELGLEEHSEGIWILPENLPLGVPLDKALQLETDYIFDIAVTPNRPDCLSHLGIAREVGALVNQHIKKPEIKLQEIKQAASEQIKIVIETPAGCPRYSARLIRNVKIGESPSWLVRRLEAVGLRPINNVVDITNYVLMETGHPLHAFDYELIQGEKIIVREAQKNEKFTTLDDKERILKKGTVLICDAQEPVAIGGIMGGLNSEVSTQTQHVLLESAYFNPQ